MHSNQQAISRHFEAIRCHDYEGDESEEEQREDQLEPDEEGRFRDLPPTGKVPSLKKLLTRDAMRSIKRQSDDEKTD